MDLGSPRRGFLVAPDLRTLGGFELQLTALTVVRRSSGAGGPCGGEGGSSSGFPGRVARSEQRRLAAHDYLRAVVTSAAAADLPGARQSLEKGARTLEVILQV
jgi:hypothetical protein